MKFATSGPFDSVNFGRGVARLERSRKDPNVSSHARGILFLCVANSVRSQMAEGLARALLSDSVRIQSAGTKPGRLHPIAVRVMAEIGIDISAQRAKPVESVDPRTVDVVITLCAEEGCPLFLTSAKWIHWPVADPATAEGDEAERLVRFRQVRDQLRRRIATLAID
ncbi:MAG: arsenate reductase ArsC [Candidatus Binataceae bacterium]